MNGVETHSSVTIMKKSDQRIDPRLLTNFTRLQGPLGRKPVQLIQGYRSLMPIMNTLPAGEYEAAQAVITQKGRRWIC